MIRCCSGNKISTFKNTETDSEVNVEFSVPMYEYVVHTYVPIPELSHFDLSASMALGA